ncbi:ROK family glucokinase [Hominifimenecus sp. rT4P-3]|uniref:ROK family glucokinase n=1 Tax=Hominifimenecus sp. rT4P-3 TaxID=3242979 RepID=UPI003DA37542
MYFGVDIGGTTIKLGRFQGEGVLQEKWEIPTRIGENGKYIFDDIAASILNHAVQAGLHPSEIRGVGMGIPGPVLPDGYMEVGVNIGVREIYPSKELSKRLGIPLICCENDANVAALGESWKGGGAGFRSMFLLTIGTGVGGGAVLDGKVRKGAHGIAGEIGHITVRLDETETCNCGNRGCLEQYASATGIVREAKRVLMGTTRPSVLREIRNLTAKDVMDAAKAGDPLALGVAEDVGGYLAWAMSSVSYIVDPEVFVIGGGVSAAGEFLIDLIRKKYDVMTKLLYHKAEIRLATLGNEAGIYGAVRLVLG